MTDVDRDSEGRLTDDRPLSSKDLVDIGIALHEYAQTFLSAEDIDRLEHEVTSDDELLSFRCSQPEDERGAWEDHAEHLLRLAARMFIRARALQKGRVLP